MKRFIMRSFMVLVIILAAWIIFAQGCMTFRSSDSAMKKKFRKNGIDLKTATEKIHNRNIHYAKVGVDSLPTIVFMHGTPGSWDAFSDYMQDKDLLQRFRMISIDRPGFGYSDFGKAETVERQVELMTPLFYKFDNDKPMFLAAHSLGAPVIIKLAADNPGLFDGLVIISGSLDPAVEKPEKWRPVLFNTPLNLLVPGAFRASNMELWYLKKDLVKLKNDFSKVICPVYFIHGNKDTWVPSGNVGYAKKLLTNASKIEEVTINGGNHFIPWTKYQEIKQVLIKLNSF